MVRLIKFMQRCSMPRCYRVLSQSLVFLPFLIPLVTMAQEKPDEKPSVSEKPMTPEQFAVYRGVLDSWFQGSKGTVNLAIETLPIGSSSTDDKDCGKTLDLEAVVKGEVHRFRLEDLSFLGSTKFHLVDPDLQEQEVAENDPGKKIREGVSVDDAVKGGFAHGLFTLGEIRFDKDHTHAIVRYGFHCGSLCGNGGTVILKKKGQAWVITSRCSSWIS